MRTFKEFETPIWLITAIILSILSIFISNDTLKLVIYIASVTCLIMSKLAVIEQTINKKQDNEK